MGRETEYDRGRRQGEVSTQLKEHAEHLAHINGSMDRVADRLSDVTDQLAAMLQGIARIDQAMTADKETVRQTAAALRDQVDSAGARETIRWTPFSRLLAVGSTLAGLGTVTYLVLH